MTWKDLRLRALHATPGRAARLAPAARAGRGRGLAVAVPAGAGPPRRRVGPPRRRAGGRRWHSRSPRPRRRYRFAGQRWPNREITVSNGAPAYDGRWPPPSGSGTELGWECGWSAHSDARARVLIRYGRGRGGGLSGCEGINGAAVIGYPGPWLCGHGDLGAPQLPQRATAHRDRRARARARAGPGPRRPPVRGHELAREPGRQARHVPGARPRPTIRRSLLSSDDIRGARALYRRRAPTVVSASSPPSTRATARACAGGRRRSASGPRFATASSATGGGSAIRTAAPPTRQPGSTARTASTSRGTYTVTLSVSDGGRVIARRSQRLTLF